MSPGGTGWRADLDALAFRPPGHAGACVMHRLAFRVFLGPDPSPEGCLAFEARWPDAFRRAAAAKIRRRGLPPGTAFHLTSRDLRAALPSGSTA